MFSINETKIHKCFKKKHNISFSEVHTRTMRQNLELRLKKDLKKQSNRIQNYHKRFSIFDRNATFLQI